MDHELKWWQETIVYQIYPRSFADSDGDGIGDLRGIISKLDYLKDLGVGTLWLSPVYASPNEDNGYDISDYYSIHPDFGTMEDFDTLIMEAKSRGICIVMDLVINHTSTEHRWFQLSRRKIEPYTGYYYWSDEWDDAPNNWTGFFGEKCWEQDDVRAASYLHLFAKHQADLNYHNPDVLKEVKKILTFWLDKGVKGFRCDVINILYKDSLKSSRKKLILTGSEHYLSLDGTHKILKELADIVKTYDAFMVGETVFVDTKEAMKLTAPERGELNMVFGFEHMEADQVLVKWFKKKFRWKKFMRILARWQTEVKWNTIYFENHDQPRSVSRFGSARYPEESAKLLAVLLLTLKGTPFIYEGQEIGMTNFDYTSMEDVKDVESININNLLKSLHFPKSLRWKMIRQTCRDNARTPMQWTDGPGAGFSKGIPWLKINRNYKEINVEAQMKDSDSVFGFYRKMIAFRKSQKDLREGEFSLIAENASTGIYRRGDLTVVLNYSDKPANIREEYGLNGMKICINSGTMEKVLFDGKLAPWQAVILK